MLKRFRLLLAVIFITLQAAAQPAEKFLSRSEYISLYKDEAIKQMQLHRIPASITLAQGILESGDGNSPLAKYANNHFGIKCHNTWSGPVFYEDDDARNECFRRYYSPVESYEDHSLFIKSRKWYQPLFDLKTTDYKGWAYGLKKAGYATHPRYAEMLIEIIEQHDLQDLDKMEMISQSVKDVKPRIQPVAVTSQQISFNNQVQYTHARKGDDAASIAKRFAKGTWEIYKYNEMSRDQQIKEGQIVYLRPKRTRSQNQYHITEKGQTLWEISQFYGVKEKCLRKYNLLPEGMEPRQGQKIFLRKHKTRK